MRLPLLSYGRGVPAAVHRLVVASGGHHRGLLRVLAAVLSAARRLPALAGPWFGAAHCWGFLELAKCLQKAEFLR